MRRPRPVRDARTRPAATPARAGSDLAARALAALVFGVGALGLAHVGCGADAPRRGGAGESCVRTDDCEAPLRCLGGVCASEAGGAGGSGAAPASGPGGAGGSSGPGVGGAGGSKGPGPGGAGPGGNENTGACDACLDEACAAEEAGCGDGCRGIEGCIQTFCKHLSEIGALEQEGQCQVKCQGEHPGAKAAHLALVECANGSSCQPPCVFFPQDYDACRATVLSGSCGGARGACEASLACKNFGDCVGFCETAADCFACDDDEAGQEGRALFEAVERCVARECLAEAWLPNF